MSLAWQPLGFEPVFFSDFDPENPFPTRFLAHRFPEVPNLGDMTRIDGRRWRGKVDALWGSTPCQAFSLAGMRQGIKDPRGALTPALVGLANDIAPDFLCWENVEGALTDKDNAFGLFLAALSGSDEVLVPPGKRWGGAGYVVGPERVIAWRLLDAQHFELPQQRRRVFLVACPRNGADPRKILFEPAAVQAVAGQRAGGEADALVGADPGFDAFAVSIRGRVHDGVSRSQIEQGRRVSNCLRASQGGSDKGMVLTNQTGVWRVRNMTPIEGERCMGMPDDWTLSPGASDSARYHAIGNSVPVPCVRFIGEGLARVHR